MCEKKKDLPKEFTEYFNYVNRLKFDETPDYDYLRGLFHNLFVEHNFELDFKYDWIIKIEKQIEQEREEDKEKAKLKKEDEEKQQRIRSDDDDSLGKEEEEENREDEKEERGQSSKKIIASLCENDSSSMSE